MAAIASRPSAQPWPVPVKSYIAELGDLRTELCDLGAKYGTDKTPHHTRTDLHRHGYTAFYHQRFGHLREQPIVLGEVGILNNASMRMWREYLHPGSLLCGFDNSQRWLDEARAQNLPATWYGPMDVTQPRSIRDGFSDAVSTFARAPFTLIVEDSTHVPEHQVNVAREAMRLLAPGGWLIIEDVFRDLDVESRILTPLLNDDPWMAKNVGLIEIVTVNHDRDYTPGWNNSKLLLIQRAA